MKIAVFGTGLVGQTLAEKLASLAHEVTMGTRDVKKSKGSAGQDKYGRPAFGEWYKDHNNIRLATFRDAAAASELIVNATNGMGSLSALGLAGNENLKGKVVLDVSNPLDFSKGMPPSLFVCNTDSLGEQIQREFPEAKVVKSLHTMNSPLMVNPGMIPGNHSVFVGGNDADAKNTVKNILISFGWKDPNIIDLGDITSARGTEQLMPIWVILYSHFQSPFFNFQIVKAAAQQ